MVCIEIFDQQGNYLESRYLYGRVSGIFITDDDTLYAIDSESTEGNHFGSRIVIANDGNLFITTGDRGAPRGSK